MKKKTPQFCELANKKKNLDILGFTICLFVKPLLQLATTTDEPCLLKLWMSTTTFKKFFLFIAVPLLIFSNLVFDVCPPFKNENEHIN